MARKFKSKLETLGIQVREIRNFARFCEAVATESAESFKIQLAYDSPFALAQPIEKADLRIHSFEDIATGKLLALFGRAEERDFIDAYFVVKNGGITLSD